MARIRTDKPRLGSERCTNGQKMKNDNEIGHWKTATANAYCALELGPLATLTHWP